MDLPGQGFTTLKGEDFVFDLDGMTDALGAFLDAVGISSTALGGNSWSDGLALAFAQAQPERVSSLMLMAPSGLDETDPTSWEMLKLPVVGANGDHQVAPASRAASLQEGVAGMTNNPHVRWPTTDLDAIGPLRALGAGVSGANVTERVVPHSDTGQG